MSKGRMLGLDALRAGAVVAVMVSHVRHVVPASPEWAEALFFLGKTGVNAFFALSGYLIGGIAFRTIAATPDVWTFWQRRWLRTLPAALAVLVVCSLVMAPGWGEFLATATFTRFAFDGMSGSFVRHYWSLAVEEWAYLLLPWLVLALRGRDPLPWLAGAWCCLALGREATVILAGLDADSALHATALRLDAILVGVVAALAAPRLDAGQRMRLALIGCVGILVAHIGPRPLSLQGALMPALFALTLPWLAVWRPSGRGPVWAVTLLVAELSYSLYLVHFPIFVAAGHLGRGHWLALLAAVGASAATAVLLRHAVELRFMALRDRRWGRRKVLQAAG